MKKRFGLSYTHLFHKSRRKRNWPKKENMKKLGKTTLISQHSSIYFPLDVQQLWYHVYGGNRRAPQFSHQSQTPPLLRWQTFTIETFLLERGGMEREREKHNPRELNLANKVCDEAIRTLTYWYWSRVNWCFVLTTRHFFFRQMRPFVFWFHHLNTTISSQLIVFSFLR